MDECSLDFLYVVSWSTDVDLRVLWVLNAQTTSVLVRVPPLGLLAEVAAFLPDRDSDVVVVELLAVELEEFD